MNKSFFADFFTKVFSGLKCWFENSLYFKIWSKIMAFFGGFLSRSFIDFFFCKKREINFVENSALSRFANKIVSFFDFIIGKPCRFFCRKFSQSIIGSSVIFLLKNWQYISVRYYSVSIFSFGCISMALEKANYGFISNRWIVITVTGMVGYLFKHSPSQLLSGEFILSRLKPKFTEAPKVLETKPLNSISLAVIVGAVLGAMSFVPGLLVVILGIIAFTFIISKPFTLVFLSVVLLPYLPTMVLVALMLLTMFIALLHFSAKKNKMFRLDGLDLAVFGLVLMNIYGVLNSETPLESAKIAAVYITFVLFFFILRRFLSNIKRFFITIDLFIISATAVAGYGIIEQIFGLSETTWQDEEMFEEIAGRACSTFENPNVLGEFLLLTIPITLARIFYSKKLLSKLMFTAFASAQALCMVFTYSRGCWLGIMLAVLIFLAFCGKKILTFMSLGVFALPFVIPQSVIDRLLSIGNTADTSTAYRVFIWEGTSRMLSDNWLFGIGLGSKAFNNVYPRYALGAITAPHPHNLYLLIMSETGLLGMILVGIALICFFRCIGRICRSNPQFKVFGVALGAAMGGFLLQGMFDNVWYNYRIYALFFMIFAFVGALRDIAEVKNDD